MDPISLSVAERYPLFRGVIVSEDRRENLKLQGKHENEVPSEQSEQKIFRVQILTLENTAGLLYEASTDLEALGVLRPFGA